MSETEKSGLEELVSITSEELRRLKARSEMFEHSEEGMLIVDPEGRVVDANPAIEDLLGVDLSEVVGSGLQKVFNPNDTGSFLDYFGNILSGKDNSREVYELLDVSGNPSYVEVYGSLQEDGKMVSLFLKDVTDYILHEKQFEAFVKNLSSGVIVYEAVDDGRDFRIKYMNPAGQKISHVEKLEDVLGGLLTEVFPEAIETGFLKAFRKANETGVNEEYGPVHYKGDGVHPIWVMSRITPLGKGKIVVSYDDVTKLLKAERTLKETEKKYLDLLENVVDLVVFLDKDRKIVDCSESFLDFFGYKKTELIKKSTRIIHISDESFRRFGENLRRSIGGTGYFRGDYTFLTKGGEISLETITKPYFDNKGELKGFIAVLRDNSKLRETLENLRRSKERFKGAVEDMGWGYYETGLDGNITFLNEQFAQILGYSVEELKGKHVSSLFDEENAVFWRELFREVYKTKKKTDTKLQFRHKEGEEVMVVGFLSLIYDEKGNVVGYRGGMNDITPLYKLANFDVLTGIYNRQAFMAKLEYILDQYWRDKQPAALMYLDLDYFKRVNDTYGHNIGDEVLKQFADKVQNKLRRKTDIFGRIGGEEFGLIVSGEKPEELAERIIEEISKKPLYKRGDVEVGMTVSIGVAPFRDRTSLDEILDMADQALYAAKESGRNRYVVYKPA